MRRLTMISAVAALGLLAAGCSAGAGAAGDPPRSGSGSSAAPKSPATATSPTKPPVPAVRLGIAPATGNQAARPDTGISVAAAGGTVRSVQVQTAGSPVAGTLNATRTAWHSTWALSPSTSYSVTVAGVNTAGVAATATSTFRTLTPDDTFQASIEQTAGATYGVGMPIQLTFSQPITDRAAVERALQLRASHPVVGAWSWLDDEHLDFRPRDYWPAGTQVHLGAHLAGVPGAPGVYGAADLSQSFTIGSSVIVTASTTTHHMQLYVNGRLHADWPISTGKPGHDTPNGTYVTINKGNPVEMKPADIKPGQPGYYDLMVPWSTRFTWSGIFLHDAYWSVGNQGYSNVSHGCVNMPPAAAEEYYKMAVPGDPVTVTGSPDAGSPGDGYTDWFQSWPQLLAASALHQAVLAGPRGSSFVAPAGVPASAARAPLGTAAPGNANAS